MRRLLALLLLAAPPLWAGSPAFTGSARLISTDVPQSDADSLIRLYQMTAGDSWTDKTNWLKTATVASWTGITVTAGRITRVQKITKNLVGSTSGWVLPGGLVDVILNTNAGLTGDLTTWTIPDTLDTLYVYLTGLSGDLSAWVPPVGLLTLNLNNTSITGDISGWTLPTGLQYLYVNNTALSGDVSGWTLPASLLGLRLNSTSVTGDVSGWAWPAGLATLNLSTSALSGDISGWVIPGLSIFDASASSISGVPDLSACTGAIIAVQNCALTQANVDAWLAAIYVRRAGITFASTSINLSGTNAAPSGVYQDGDPPTTGLEYAYELCNDPEAEGFHDWAITWTGGSCS